MATGTGTKYNNNNMMMMMMIDWCFILHAGSVTVPYIYWQLNKIEAATHY
jgi:hypothetical protein